jgi:glycerophosphoryl diester phosphodiesterase
MQVIGHRGAAALAPENTWESFNVALEIGVDAIETDVRATSDGELVLIHDEHLDRTTNGKGLIHMTPWSVVRTLDAGSWFSEEYRGVRVPLLRDTLERYGQLTHLVLEIKQPGIELRVVEMVCDLGLIDRVTFTSFEFAVVQRIKAEIPVAKVGLLTSNIGCSNVMRVLDAHLDQFCPPAATITRTLVSSCKDLGLEVRAWGVTNIEIMMTAVRAEVDGMTVDFPHLLLKALGRER